MRDLAWVVDPPWAAIAWASDSMVQLFAPSGGSSVTVLTIDRASEVLSSQQVVGPGQQVIAIEPDAPVPSSCPARRGYGGYSPPVNLRTTLARSVARAAYHRTRGGALRRGGRVRDDLSLCSVRVHVAVQRDPVFPLPPPLPSPGCYYRSCSAPHHHESHIAVR